MAVADALASIQVLDNRGEIGSMDVPFQYTVGTTTLANIVSWIQGLGAAVDLVSDGQITKLRVSLLIPLPGGIKSAPASGADLEKTGLITWSVAASANAYGEDIPAIKNAELAGNAILFTETNMAALTAYMLAVTTGIAATDRYGNPLSAIKRGKLTFRKHRRALRSA